MNRSPQQTGLPESLSLFARAAKVTPGGIHGHTSPALTVPGAFPYYAARSEGCRYWDVDGREYIDYMCGYGPIVLGYNHPEVEEAAERQRRDGNCFNHPTAANVELAEYLVDKIDFASWAVFGKNGSDLTTWAIQVAREKTKRKKILIVQGGYHGAHAWCTPGHGGLIEEDRAHIHSFKWNDVGSFEEMVIKHRGNVAGLIICPFHHPSFGDSVLPAEDFFRKVQAICRREGIVFILDDVRAGFRLHMGGSHRYFGFEPDLAVYCKALGNGHPIAAAVGREDLKISASRVFLTGSYWNSAVPMRAALATLKILERDNGIEKMRAVGQLLMDGLEELGKKHGLSVRCSGPPATPFMSFTNETNWYRQQRFCSEVTGRGSFFHPHHNWFVCAAHNEKDIRETLAAADAAFAIVRDEFGS